MLSDFVKPIALFLVLFSLSNQSSSAQEQPQASSSFSTECVSAAIGNYYLFLEIQLDKKTFEGLGQAAWLSIDGYQSGRGRVAGPLDKSNVKLSKYMGENALEIVLQDMLGNKVEALIPTKISADPRSGNLGFVVWNENNSYEVKCNHGAKDPTSTQMGPGMGMGMGMGSY